MKYIETKKLFFGQYLYRYKMKSPLAFYFYKTSKFKVVIDAVEAVIANLKEQCKKSKNQSSTVKRWNRSFEVALADVEQIEKIKDILVNHPNEFRTRTEMNDLSIYTNNENLIDLLEKSTDVNTTAELSKPNVNAKDVLAGNKEIYVVNKPSDYKFRLTVAGKMNNSKEIAKWLEENSEKVKASSTAILGFKKEYWQSNLLFYVRDEKILILAQMMFGESIRKIEKIVFVGDRPLEHENA